MKLTGSSKTMPMSYRKLVNDFKNIFQLYSFVENIRIFPDVISGFSALLHEDKEHLIEKIILSNCQLHQIILQSYSNHLPTHHHE